MPTASGAVPEWRLAKILKVFDPLLAPSRNASNLVDGVYTPAMCLQFVPTAVDPITLSVSVEPFLETMKKIWPLEFVVSA
jgi:hypothetical protein